jgi:glyoxylase-like metal-dependent hydrolase (beta-lactamase superfamily II)
MDVQSFGGGMWRWTVPHPEWTPEKGVPGGWAREVSSVYVEAPDAEAVVLIDPLVPREGSQEAERFWTTLDADLARSGRKLAVLLASPYHQRSTARIRERLAVTHAVDVHAMPGVAARHGVLVTRTFASGATLPGGIVGYEVEGAEPGEAAYWIPSRRALVLGDTVLGTGDGLAVAPMSWAPRTPEGEKAYRERFRASLRNLLELPVELVLPSHGPAVATEGRAALAAALEAPAWGD